MYDQVQIRENGHIACGAMGDARCIHSRRECAKEKYTRVSVLPFDAKLHRKSPPEKKPLKTVKEPHVCRAMQGPCRGCTEGLSSLPNPAQRFIPTLAALHDREHPQRGVRYDRKYTVVR